MAIRLNQKTGYSRDTYNEVFGNVTPIFLAGASGLELKNKFVDGKMTNEPDKVTGEFYFPEIGVASVKFPVDMEVPTLQDMQTVELLNAEAVVIKNDVYVRAESVRVMA